MAFDLSVFKNSLYEALFRDFGLKKCPDPTVSSATLAESDFPWVMLKFTNNNVSNLQFSTSSINMDVGLEIEFSLMADQDHYEDAILQQISALLPWISQASEKITSECLVKAVPNGFNILGWNNSFCAGGGQIQTTFTLRAPRC